MNGIEINAGTLVMYLIQAVILILIILLIKIYRNGGLKSPMNGNPGKAKTCIEHGEKITEHDTVLKHLCKDIDEEKSDRKQFRKDVRDNVRTIFSELRKINGSR